MECTILTSKAEWSCRVSIRAENASAVPYSPLLRNKGDVEIWIRRAQAEVLCPHLPRDHFRNRSREEIKELTDRSKHAEVREISTDKVVIDIEDPDGADLAFVDLPGTIAFACADGACMTDSRGC